MVKLAPNTSGPLAGVVVVDLTRVLAGPYCTMVLADLGARVIKVEIPDDGDDARAAGPFLGGEDGSPRTSAYFFSVNRNKESIALNLKDADDRALFEDLVDGADVLIENYRPGTLDRLGYGWTGLHERWPSLILASISGFGQSGPYTDYPAYDIVAQAMGGVMSLTGLEDGEPVRVGISIGDLAAGMFGALGVQAALFERTRTGVGRHVDIAMLDGQVALLENALTRYQVDGVVPGPIGTRHPSITPFAAFRAKDRHVIIGVGNDAMFARLCETIDAPDLPKDPRFRDNGARTTNQAALREAMESRLSVRTRDEWIPLLRASRVPCAPLNDVADVMAEPQVHHRDMLVSLPVPGGRSLTIAGCPVKFADGGDRPTYTAAPMLDEHGAAIRAEIAAAKGLRETETAKIHQDT